MQSGRSRGRFRVFADHALRYKKLINGTVQIQSKLVRVYGKYTRRIVPPDGKLVGIKIDIIILVDVLK